MGSVVEFYEGHKGKFIDAMELSTHCVWAASDVGRAEFDLVKKDNPKVTERLTRPGNMIRIFKDPRLNLPPWDGVLDDDNGWMDGRIKITARTPHQLYTWRDARVMRKNGKVYDDEAGQIIRALIQLCNSDEDLRVRAGKIAGGAKIQETLDSYIYDSIRNIADQGYYWQFRSTFGADKGLLFLFDFTQTLGRVLTNVQLIEGHNFEKGAGQQILRQVGPIVNQYTAMSDVSSEEERIYATEEDKKSIAKYRLRQSADVLIGIQNEANVKLGAQVALRQLSNPRNVPSIVAQNVDNLFQKIRLGNVLAIVYKESGWSASNTGLSEPIKITVMDHNDQTPGKITLTADVVES